MGSRSNSKSKECKYAVLEVSDSPCAAQLRETSSLECKQTKHRMGRCAKMYRGNHPIEIA